MKNILPRITREAPKRIWIMLKPYQALRCFTILLLLIFFLSSWSVEKNEGREVDDCISFYDSLAQEEIYLYVDKMPEYNGGDPAMLKFIRNNFCHPEDDELQSRFDVLFLIDEEGNVIRSAIRNKAESEYTKTEIELLKVMKGMPRWQPGECQGKKVKVQVSLPLRINIR
jgi:hypothetical protein